MRTLRVGLYGTGFGERVLMPAICKVAGVRVTAVCSRDALKAHGLARAAGAPTAHTDWRKLTQDTNVDALALALPPSSQGRVALAALKAGKHVFLEKPVSVKLADASRLLRAAKRSRLAHAVDFEFPENPLWDKARKALRSGRIGRLRHVDVRWDIETYACQHGLNDTWKTDPASGGGALNLFASHTLHYLEWFAGPIRTIGCRLLRAPDQTSGADTLATLDGTYASGAAYTARVSIQSFAGTGHRIALYGGKGTIILDNPTNDYIDGFTLEVRHRAGGAPGRGVRTAARRAAAQGADGRIAAVSRVFARFARWARTGRRTQPSLTEGVRVQRLLHLARRSSAAGGKTARV